MKVQAAVSYSPNEPLVIEEVILRDILNPHEVLVRVIASGVCHTDILVRDAPPDNPLMPHPSIPGHEGVGIVERTGSAVTDFSPGDRVIMSYDYDGTCKACSKGLNPYCENYLDLNLVGKDSVGSHVHMTKAGPASILHQQSSFTTHTICTDRNLFKVIEDIPLLSLGPIGCGFMTGVGGIKNVLQPQPDSSIAIFGLGAVGMAALCMAKKSGCTTIIGIDLHQNRLDLAIELGATHVVDASQGEVIEKILALYPGGVNHVLEATGVPAVMSQASEVLSEGGHCLLCGGVSDPTEKAEFSPFSILSNRHIHGCRMGHSHPKETIGTVLSMIADGSFPIHKLINYYEFEDVNQAIEDSEKGYVIKPVLIMPD